MTKNIPVGPNHFALVDDEDFELVSQYKWNARLKKGTDRVYAYTWVDRVSRTTGKQLLMHKLITGFAKTDHINGNGLDNRRSNLRDGSGSVNSSNAAKTKRPTTSRFKGVAWNKNEKKWVAKVRWLYKTINLGYFASEEDAALAYDRKARELWGEAACVNFPLPGERGAL